MNPRSDTPSLAPAGPAPLRIPQSNPGASYRSHQSEIDAAIARVLQSGWYLGGEEARRFEEEFSRFLGTRHAVAVGSGTDALHLALRASGVGAGDEVVTVSHTAVATVAAIEHAGATPVLVDVDPANYCLDPKALAHAITPRTRAIVPVHLYGHPAPMDAITDLSAAHNLRIIEDCAQSHGAKWRGRLTGTFGNAAIFSFYPTKNLGAFGDGGLIATDDAAVADQARALREYGWRQRYVSDRPGFNSRLDELQAAILRAKLPRLAEKNDRRRKIAHLYNNLLSGTAVVRPTEAKEAHHVYHQYVVRTPRRDDLQAHLRKSGIGALVHYPVPVHLQKAYEARLRRAGPLARTEQLAKEVLSLPTFPELADEEVAQVAQAVLVWDRR